MACSGRLVRRLIIYLRDGLTALSSNCALVSSVKGCGEDVAFLRLRSVIAVGVNGNAVLDVTFFCGTYAGSEFALFVCGRAFGNNAVLLGELREEI